MPSRASCNSSVGYYSQPPVVRQQNHSIQDGSEIGVRLRKAPFRRCPDGHIPTTCSTVHSRLVYHILWSPARPPDHKYGHVIEMKNRPRILGCKWTRETSSDIRLRHHTSAPRGQSRHCKTQSLCGNWCRPRTIGSMPTTVSTIPTGLPRTVGIRRAIPGRNCDIGSVSIRRPDTIVSRDPTSTNQKRIRARHRSLQFRFGVIHRRSS